MAITGNKGEWSEIYTLFKLLGEEKVYAGDQNLNKIEALFYPIIRILRHEKEGDYNYCLENHDVVIQTPDGMELLRMQAAEFLLKSENLLQEIKEGTGAFSIPDVEEFMNSIYCRSLKAKSSDKTDIHIILHDPRTKINSEIGFSIKSQLGGHSTLINASKATNFIYKIVDHDFSKEEINKINSINTDNKVIARYNEIKKLGGKLIFDKIESLVFENNLIMLDGNLPEIMAVMLVEEIDSGVSKFPELVKNLTERNPLNFDTTQNTPYYTYKLKHLLISSALGMMPATPWNGRFDANGGYLVVKGNGDVLCYHIYDKNRFEDYLFTNAYLERASTTRHGYATIEELDKTFLFKLNLQVRLK